MSTAYGTIACPKPPAEIRPLSYTLKNKQQLSISPIDKNDQATIKTLHAMFNVIVAEGNTYPQEHELTEQEFKQYFLASECFVARTDKVVGAFYVKPNFPGRCAHTCNAGFIVDASSRGLGIGRCMGQAFLEIAPQLGYRQSMFNLVFVSNEASVRLWRSLGFKEIGRIPSAGRLKGYDQMQDAIQFYHSFARTD